MTIESTRWDRELQDALAVANVPTLLMVMVHLTGDTRWLSERYRCSSPRGLDDNDSGGLPDDVQTEVRQAAGAAIRAWHYGTPPALPDPDLALLHRMVEASVGEPVPDGYGEMIARALGIGSGRDAFPAGSQPVPEGFSVIIIGAGIAGMCAGIRLKGLGIPFTIYEKNVDVGGTWFENHYPGAGVDTPSHLYSYSFAKRDWTKYFSLRDEIQAYLQDVESRFGLREHIRFSTTVERADYLEAEHRWSVHVAKADGITQVSAPILISAVGLLNIPKVPVIPGLDDFGGPHFHSAEWPGDLDVRGKRVGIIGNGASAMQIAPAIAGEVDRLVIFQRSKQWAAPFEQFLKPIPLPVRFLLREVPKYQEWYRQRLAWIFNDRIHATLQIDPSWPHMDRSINARNDRHRAMFAKYIQDELGDRQDLLPDVLPDYPPFGKRMLMDNGWFRTMTRPNVRLVNTGIDRVEPDAVVTADGSRYQLDVLVLATGFDAINVLSSFDLHGRDGRAVREMWHQNGPEAFFGLSVPGFPNFFMLTGPNTALGHGGSVIPLIETQVDYIVKLLVSALAAHPEGFAMEVRRNVHDTFNGRVRDAHDKMIWSHKGMTNWYRNTAGRVIATTPFRNDDYWQMLRRADLSDYEVTGAGTTNVDRST